MFEITITTDFSAAHKLNNYKGKCENLHGHNFIVEVSVLCKKLDGAYIAMDFKDLKRITNDVVDKLDHKFLNDMEYFNKTNPTSEMIAKYIYEKIGQNFDVNCACRMSRVSVYENKNSKATYYEGE